MSPTRFLLLATLFYAACSLGPDLPNPVASEDTDTGWWDTADTGPETGVTDDTAGTETGTPETGDTAGDSGTTWPESGDTSTSPSDTGDTASGA